jgi:Na+/H+ antiporter NhaD/arsenite permease-like protein
MTWSDVLTYSVLALTYLGLGLGYLPGYRMNRAAIAITGAALLVVLGVLNLEEAWAALDPNTLIFLFGVMVLNAHLGYAGFFQLVMDRLVHFAKSPPGPPTWAVSLPSPGTRRTSWWAASRGSPIWSSP